MEFKLTKGDYIELTQLLKASNLVYSGSDAKSLIDEGQVKLNGLTELRRRAKVRVGDEVEAESTIVKVI